MIECAAVFDIGTSSLKGALIDKDGEVYKTGRLFFPSQIIAENWLISFENLFKQFSDFANRKNIKIVGICISGNGPTLVSVSKNKNQLLLWNETKDNLKGEKSKSKNSKNEKTDSELLAKKKKTKSIFLPRLELFKEIYTQEFKNAEYIFSGQEFLIYKLTGKAVTVLPEKRYIPAYWTDEELELFQIEKSKLPPFVELGADCGTYRDIPVFAGPPDFISALIGTNTLKAGKACDRAGSSEGVNLCVAEIPPKEKLDGLLVLPSPIAALWNVSYKLSHSGNIFYDYIKENGGNFMDFDSFMKSISEIQKTENGEYPDGVAGEGKRIVENLARQIKGGMDALEKATGFKPIYTLCGGQANCKLWCEMKSELTGRKFQKQQISDAELLGNTAIVFSSLGEYKNIADAAKNICKSY